MSDSSRRQLLAISLAIPVLFLGMMIPVFASSLSSSDSVKVINLSLSYKSTASSPSSVFTVRCLGSQLALGSHPNRKAICKLLEAQTKANNILFLKFPQNMMCTQIYGGPETASVTGSYYGQKVDTTYSRTDGCKNGRWLSALPLFTFPGYSTVAGDIVVSPTCPGPIHIDPSPSPSTGTPGYPTCVNPSAGGTVTFMRPGKAILVQAMKNTGFAILLPNGQWQVSAKTPSAMHCTILSITVPLTASVQYKLDVMRQARLAISCDTGMR